MAEAHADDDSRLPARRARAEDASPIVEILVDAFHADPFINWFVGGRGPKARRIYVEMVLHRLTLPHGEVWVDPGLRGAALWTPPEAWNIPVAEQLSILPILTRAVGLRRLFVAARCAELVEAARPPQPWYYLALIGALPAAQGQGIGRALLAPVLERCDREGVPAVLETSVLANVRWYARQGFVIHGEIDLPDGGPHLWMMRRPPGGSAGPLAT